jgi:hypothetical protein
MGFGEWCLELLQKTKNPLNPIYLIVNWKLEIVNLKLKIDY